MFSGIPSHMEQDELEEKVEATCNPMEDEANRTRRGL